MPFIHETAVIDAGAKIGAGSSIWHFVHLCERASVGKDVVLGQNVFVANDVVIADGCRVQNNVSLYSGVILEAGVFVGPSAVFTNVNRPRAKFPRKDQFARTLIREGATIGANATIVCGRVVGVCAFIAAGAVVTKDVPDFAMVRGTPARICGHVCRCGEPLSFDAAEGKCNSCDRCYCLDANKVTEVET